MGGQVVAGRRAAAPGADASAIGFGVDGDDAPAATQHLDHVAAVAAAEIDVTERSRRNQARSGSSAVINVRRGGRSRSFSAVGYPSLADLSSVMRSEK